MTGKPPSLFRALLAGLDAYQQANFTLPRLRLGRDTFEALLEELAPIEPDPEVAFIRPARTRREGWLEFYRAYWGTPGVEIVGRPVFWDETPGFGWTWEQA